VVFQRIPLRVFLAALLGDLLLAFFAVFLAALLDRFAAAFFTAFLADFLTAFFFFAVLRAVFAARFGAARFFLRVGATAIGGTIMGSETSPSAASGM
jgi:hypothetical protein